MKLREEAIQKMTTKIETAARVINHLKKADKNLSIVLERLSEIKGEKSEQLRRKISNHRDTLKSFAERFFFINPKGIQSDPNKISTKLWRTQNYLLSSYDRPSQMFEISFNDFSASLDKVVNEVNNYFQSSWIELINEINESQVQLIEKFDKIE